MAEDGVARGITRDEDRHGNVRLYYRRRGVPKIRLREKEGTDAFEEELACARLGIPYQPKVSGKRIPGQTTLGKAAAGTFRWLVEEYMRREVAGQAEATRTKKRAVFDEICNETCLSKSETPAGMMAYRGFELRHIAMLRDCKVGKPEAANHRIKALSALFTWAIGAGLATTNPAKGCPKVKSTGGGHHTITREELVAYEETHPAGTMAHIAMTVFRYTGLRVCDAAVFGRQHLYSITLPDGSAEQRFRIKPKKTSNSSGVVVDLPILPPLATALDAIEAKKPEVLAFITNEWGNAFTVKGLGQRMRKWFDDAGLKHCSSHGIRKADAVIAAENGATSKELQAMFGWNSSREADRYTQAAERKRLGSSGAPRLIVNRERK